MVCLEAFLGSLKTSPPPSLMPCGWRFRGGPRRPPDQVDRARHEERGGCHPV